MDLIKILWHATSGLLTIAISVGIGLILFIVGLVYMFDSMIWQGALISLGGIALGLVGIKIGLLLGANR
jgi:hypothetical protein